MKVVRRMTRIESDRRNGLNVGDFARSVKTGVEGTLGDLRDQLQGRDLQSRGLRSRRSY